MQFSTIFDQNDLSLAEFTNMKDSLLELGCEIEYDFNVHHTPSTHNSKLAYLKIMYKDESYSNVIEILSKNIKLYHNYNALPDTMHILERLACKDDSKFKKYLTMLGDRVTFRFDDTSCEDKSIQFEPEFTDNLLPDEIVDIDDTWMYFKKGDNHYKLELHENTFRTHTTYWEVLINQYNIKQTDISKKIIYKPKFKSNNISEQDIQEKFGSIPEAAAIVDSVHNVFSRDYGGKEISVLEYVNNFMDNTKGI